jgi:hypothetical protein
MDAAQARASLAVELLAKQANVIASGNIAAAANRAATATSARLDAQMAKLAAEGED